METERSICRYTARARGLMLEQGTVDRREMFAESLARKQRLFARASPANQLKTALAVQNSNDRMFGDFAEQHSGDLSDIDLFLAAMMGGKRE